MFSWNKFLLNAFPSSMQSVGVCSVRTAVSEWVSELAPINVPLNSVQYVQLWVSEWVSWHRATEHLIHYMTSEISLSRQSNLPQLTTMQTVSVSVTAIMTDSKCRLCPLTAFTHSLSTAVLTQHSRTPSAQLHSLNTAALPQHSRTPSAQPHSLSTAVLVTWVNVHSSTWR